MEDSYKPPKASGIKHKRTTLERIEKYISKEYFTDVNLYGKLYPETVPISDISTFPVQGNWENWKFKDIIRQKFSSAKIGDSYGPSWSTHWFKLNFKIPNQWKDKYVVLRWISQSEAMIYNPEGECLQGLTTGTDHQLRTDYCISEKWQTSEQCLTFYIEMAGSRMFGLGKGGMINPPDPDAKFTLTKAEIAIMDTTIYHLFVDLQCLHSMAKSLPEDHRGYLALYTGNDMINKIIAGDIKSAEAVSKSFFSKTGGKFQNTLALIGNCHIDCAWLWPYSETKRKCGRSFSSAIQLLDKYEDMTFVISQAQQLQWVKECYPGLFDKIKEKVKQNRIIPVGGTWVEMDGLIPSGESFMRQFLYGQKFFLKEFGVYCKEFWLPDTFGYSAQIPQICRHFDIKRFLTQKLSWSLVNKFPHHTFLWEGLDGSTVLAHFPPGDSYEMDMQVEEMVRSEKNLLDKGRTNISGFLYGHGDGGGGPTKDMLERSIRLSNVDGLPRLKHMTPDDLFTVLEGQSENLSKWVGELYLELHNGTYTSQAKTKMWNRRCEYAARQAETALCRAAWYGKRSSEWLRQCREKCEVAWKKVLLNQFHDVLPGSSIGIVYSDSTRLYEEALSEFKAVCLEALESFMSISARPSTTFFNPFPWEMVTMIEEGFGFSLENTSLSAKEQQDQVPRHTSLTKTDNGFVLSNTFIKVHISRLGQITLLEKLEDKGAGCNQTGNGIFSDTKRGNILTIYDDVPLFWDAWDVIDYHLETRKVLNDENNIENIFPVSVKRTGPSHTILEWSCKINDSSTFRQEIRLSMNCKFLTFRTFVNWYESHKFLKVEFDTNLLSRNVLYDSQFGHVSRPTHQNTSWDTARFEVCSHKWMSISQHDLGLAILNDCKYGASAANNRISLSLLRSPKAPDGECDMADHGFDYAVMPHFNELLEVVKNGYAFSSTSSYFSSCWETDLNSLIEITDSSVILEAMKLAEDSVSSIVYRLYEALGGFAKTRIMMRYGRKAKNVAECNGMEVPRKQLNIDFDEGTRFVELSFKPFEIKTVRFDFE